MTAFHEPQNLGDLLKQEADKYYSRDVVTLAAGQHLKLGTVVAQTADGKITALNLSVKEPPTGAEKAYGVLIQETNALDADRETVLVARDATLASNALVWPAAITAAEKTAALQQLKDRGLLVRKGA